jgi:hypothetical protein
MSVGQLYYQATSISANAEGGANGRPWPIASNCYVAPKPSICVGFRGVAEARGGWRQTRKNHQVAAPRHEAGRDLEYIKINWSSIYLRE